VNIVPGQGVDDAWLHNDRRERHQAARSGSIRRWLAPLGYAKDEQADGVALHTPRRFRRLCDEAVRWGGRATAGNGAMAAFSGAEPSRAFARSTGAGVAAGGTDEGAPGLPRPVQPQTSSWAICVIRWATSSPCTAPAHEGGNDRNREVGLTRAYINSGMDTIPSPAAPNLSPSSGRQTRHKHLGRPMFFPCF